MLSIIGLGLNLKGISQEGKEALKDCKKVYLEIYTVDFPYTIEDLEKELNVSIIQAQREKVENLSLIDEAQKEHVALLVYGNPLVATTHIVLIEEAKKRQVEVKILHASSIFDAITETGLQLYKVGKISSMPQWKKSYTPKSFMEIVKHNQSIKAHSLILIDIGLPFQGALKQLEKAAREHLITLKEVVVCTSLGTEKQKISYGTVASFENKDIPNPYVIIIPSDLHFVEKEFIEQFS